MPSLPEPLSKSDTEEYSLCPGFIRCILGSQGPGFPPHLWGLWSVYLSTVAHQLEHRSSCTQVDMSGDVIMGGGCPARFSQTVGHSLTDSRSHLIKESFFYPFSALILKPFKALGKVACTVLNL